MRCLESIPVSEDIQVIVVDDNSPGADTYLEKYPELSRPYLEFIRTTEGGGAGYARNIGLDHAKGKWLLFADADDFFVEDMYDIISSYEDSEKDILFFRKKSVLSDNIDEGVERASYIDRHIDQYFKTGDEWLVRGYLGVPWGKMIKRELITKHNIRFDEVMYANDAYFSLLSGYYAETIEVINRVLYIFTYRPNSLAADLCTKPGELKIRAEVAFRSDRFMFQHGINRWRRTKSYMWRMFKQDKRLFKQYFLRLDEIYPSREKAIDDICKGHSILKLILNLYSLWLRM